MANRPAIARPAGVVTGTEIVIEESAKVPVEPQKDSAEESGTSEVPGIPSVESPCIDDSIADRAEPNNVVDSSTAGVGDNVVQQSERLRVLDAVVVYPIILAITEDSPLPTRIGEQRRIHHPMLFQHH